MSDESTLSAEDTQQEELPSMGILDHLEELRWCIIRGLVCIIIFFPIGVIFASDFIEYAKELSKVDTLLAFDPTEIFIQNFKVGFLLSLYVSLPYVIFQGWKFISPGLYQKEKQTLRYIGLISYLLFIGGSCFGMFMITPVALDFFNSLQTSAVTYMPRLQAVINFTLLIGAAMGLLSQLPILIVVLYSLGLVTVDGIGKYRNHIIVGIFIVAAFVTPPDVISQFMLAVPTWVMFELSLLFCKLMDKSAGKNLEKRRSRVLFLTVAGLITFYVLVVVSMIYRKDILKKFTSSSGPVDNIEDISHYQKLAESVDGRNELLKHLPKAEKEIYRTNTYKALIPLWEKGELTDDQKRVLFNHAFIAEIIQEEDKDSEQPKVHLRLKMVQPLPLKDLKMMYSLKVKAGEGTQDSQNYELFLPNEKNAFYYDFRENSKEDVLRRDIFQSIPRLREMLKNHTTLELRLDLVPQTSVKDGASIYWAKPVQSKTITVHSKQKK